MKKVAVLFLLLVFVCCLNSGCDMFKGKGEAEKVVESLFKERIENGGFGSDEYYSKTFWENTDEKKWESVKRLVFKAMGNLNAYSLKTWKVQSKVQTNGLSGIFVVLVYDTEYDKGKGEETITMYKGPGDKEFKILGHNFNSHRIQELVNKGIERAAGV